MTTSFRFLPDIAIADVAFEAQGNNIDELFEAAAQAVFETMVDTSTVEENIERKIALTSDTLERLLYDFLSEIVFLKDTDSMVFRTVTVHIEEKKKTFSLTATLIGDAIHPESQTLGNDVKAITMHMFEITQDKKGYKTRVVIDI
ncbi:MAG: archease [Nanoarchaeota archaeon]